MLLTTHDLEEAEKLADRVVIIDQGQVLAAGTPEELTRAGQRDEIRFGAAPGLDVASLGAGGGGHRSTEVSPGEYRVDAAPEPGRDRRADQLVGRAGTWPWPTCGPGANASRTCSCA